VQTANQLAGQVYRELITTLDKECGAGQQKIHGNLQKAMKISKKKYKPRNWVFDRPEYKKWRKEPRNLLWLFGNCESFI
jgi:hypothetical protein